MAALPPTLKPINSFIKLAKEHDKRDPVVAYYCRMYAIQKGIKLDSKSPECKTYLFGLMDQLEQVKASLLAQGNEAVGNDIVAQAHVENVCVNLFTWADTEDRKSNFNKNVVKAFYSASLLFDVLTQFGEINEECKVQQKYAKWKATYLHKCMQTGETPVPGPEGSGFEDELSGLDINNTGGQSYGDPNMPGPSTAQDFSYIQQPTPQDRPTPVPRQPAPPVNPAASSYVEPQASSYGNNASIDFTQAGKHCKFAMSALQYEDVETAVDNLNKALALLKS